MKNNVRDFISQQKPLSVVTALLSVLITAAMVFNSTNEWVTNIGFIALLAIGMAVIFSKLYRGTNVAKRKSSISVDSFTGINLLK